MTGNWRQSSRARRPTPQVRKRIAVYTNTISLYTNRLLDANDPTVKKVVVKLEQNEIIRLRTWYKNKRSMTTVSGFFPSNFRRLRWVHPYRIFKFGAHNNKITLDVQYFE